MNDVEKLFSDYVALCNRAIAENRHSFWYRQAKRLNQALWGGPNFRTVIYDQDPARAVAEFTLHFNPDAHVLTVLPPGNYETAFSWSASTSYLQDVVHERPDWYMEHPVRLDWSWIKARAVDEITHRIDGRSMAVGFVLGAAAGLVAAATVMKGERRPRRRYR